MKNSFSVEINSQNNIICNRSYKPSGCDVSIVTKDFCSSSVTRGCSVIKNTSDSSIDVTSISSAWLKFENDGKCEWYEKDKYIIHYCINCWLGEAQWRSMSLEDMGLYQTFNGHDNNSTIRFASNGTQSTNRYYPLILIEDRETHTFHFFEIECGSGWYVEVGTTMSENSKEQLYVYMSSCYEKNDGWHKTLAPSEEFKTPYAVWGSVSGGFDDAIRLLTQYKRERSLTHLDTPPVCFNNYMNCHWCDFDGDKLKKSIDAAAEVGAEIYCVDDGWYKLASGESMRSIGDWVIDESKFAPYTLEEMISYVQSKGMKFGIWLEIEACEYQTAAYKKLPLLTRRGNIIGKNRAFFDFRSDEVICHIEGVLDMLYSMGVRYIKNDYNQTTGIGADGNESLSEAIYESTLCFYAFIDRMHEKYHDLIIENCGSGAMRSDGETLSHFELQSISDQELYTCNPSILSGSMACIPPEKCGIWSYPYPLRFDDREQEKLTEEQLMKFADGKETVFNMVNSMLGLMYLSGRIEQSDEYNRNLIKEGIEVYKQIRSIIPRAYPVYPSGTIRLSDKGIKTFGLRYNNEIYLAVWNIDGAGAGKIDFSMVEAVEKIYPSSRGYECRKKSNSVEVSLPEGNSAMLIKVKI